jgi:hypothetical protein
MKAHSIFLSGCATFGIWPYTALIQREVSRPMKQSNSSHSRGVLWRDYGQRTVGSDLTAASGAKIGG